MKEQAEHVLLNLFKRQKHSQKNLMQNIGDILTKLKNKPQKHRHLPCL